MSLRIDHLSASLAASIRETCMKRAAILLSFALFAAAPAAMAASCGNTAQGFDGFLAQVKKEAAARGILLFLL